MRRCSWFDSLHIAPQHLVKPLYGALGVVLIIQNVVPNTLYLARKYWKLKRLEFHWVTDMSTIVNCDFCKKRGKTSVLEWRGLGIPLEYYSLWNSGKYTVLNIMIWVEQRKVKLTMTCRLTCRRSNICAVCTCIQTCSVMAVSLFCPDFSQNW